MCIAYYVQLSNHFKRHAINRRKKSRLGLILEAEVHLDSAPWDFSGSSALSFC